MPLYLWIVTMGCIFMYISTQWRNRIYSDKSTLGWTSIYLMVWGCKVWGFSPEVRFKNILDQVILRMTVIKLGNEKKTLVNDYFVNIVIYCNISSSDDNDQQRT